MRCFSLSPTCTWISLLYDFYFLSSLLLTVQVLNALKALLHGLSASPPPIAIVLCGNFCSDSLTGAEQVAALKKGFSDLAKMLDGFRKA